MGVRRNLQGCDGQMAVEFAVVIPAAIALVVLTVNLMVYLGDCARFDRAAPEVVRLAVTSPAGGSYSDAAMVSGAQARLEEAMDGAPWCTVGVTADGGALVSGEGIVSFIPQPQNYTCTLDFEPWIFGVGAFGARPLTIHHERSYTFDPYRPGVIT